MGNSCSSSAKPTDQIVTEPAPAAGTADVRVAVPSSAAADDDDAGGGAGWECAACTFLNGAAAGACEMCGAPRPCASLAPRAPAPVAATVVAVEAAPPPAAGPAPLGPAPPIVARADYDLALRRHLVAKATPVAASVLAAGVLKARARGRARGRRAPRGALRRG